MIYADLLDDVRLFDVDGLPQLLAKGLEVAGDEPGGILVVEAELDR